ncbi:unnamed protein product [Effrenium voratum]|uniref:Uncharacterized protein n=1 Tax=Effrenium voratum TaxID=2562239 RepID=A0AA36IIX9_9DINO|nr:unnamed protein product [Effrenium voratum]
MDGHPTRLDGLPGLAQEPLVRPRAREHQTLTSSHEAAQARAELQGGSLGDVLKSQLVELGNFVGSLQLRANRGEDSEWLSAPAAALPPSPTLQQRLGHTEEPEVQALETSFSPCSAGSSELEVLRVQMSALAQSLAGLGACVVNWSGFLDAQRRGELRRKVLSYVEPCGQLSPELQELCRDLRSMEFALEPGLARAEDGSGGGGAAAHSGGAAGDAGSVGA